jgi:hypothetical protein
MSEQAEAHCREAWGGGSCLGAQVVTVCGGVVVGYMSYIYIYICYKINMI